MTEDKKPRRKFVGSTKAPSSQPAAAQNGIPDEILNDTQLNIAMALLPDNYSFEIHKTIHWIRKENATVVGLQFPEGLQMFACTISDLLEKFTSAQVIILGDVTYGACCVDDFTARALGCDMLVHYGHSCLVPINQTSIKTLYVFVEISVDSTHLAKTIRKNFPTNAQQFENTLLHSDTERYQSVELENAPPKKTKLALVGTVQFVGALQGLALDLRKDLRQETPQSKPAGLIEGGYEDGKTEAATATGSAQTPFDSQQSDIHMDSYEVIIPQIRPLSPGEVLGCTAPKLDAVDALLYIGDGRFHLESIMIANPAVPAFRYDPYSKKITREHYDHAEMRMIRSDAVALAKGGSDAQHADNASTATWGVVLGTLGRQGSLKVLETIANLIETRGGIEYVPILISELSPQKVSLFGDELSTFVQTSCPRLSIDWGYAFPKPLLSPYEAAVTLERTQGWDRDVDGERDYPMDFYANDSRGPWTPRYGLMPPRRPRRTPAARANESVERSTNRSTNNTPNPNQVAQAVAAI
ncbi:hypothetical protein E3P92_00162 [Wallemia ichthyophaga]|uniref:2-(3-amino-3-carboxypropyl)histidine synthase subunit 1 n=1 Tax=Wallemia ichthyophaga (strain EXF-994 / CBS 113033) TaxID=1299270 RepID=R9ARJ8_WALI9|nr:Diphthamide biosynthesis protein 1 [Wallemia ichthyophaga EXF-994]EOR04847.1 Diphthamide biosynthesis protein 1 [Wallemia ichthyophaga EXF-994]TIB19062.1 hypothetical protein E3P92_00162 [Wallemia ichthyophaga]TIB37298.1 hypothetical protein E3P84_00322 [Wallemia ichthyophaga]TIB43756.1 hypothetical protein E3P83_00465 [Wallemia ichthyophaga]